MASTPSLSDLIARWRELRQEGRAVSAADLGGDCPELLSDPSRCLEAVAFMEDFLGLARDSSNSHETPSPLFPASPTGKRGEGAVPATRHIVPAPGSADG